MTAWRVARSLLSLRDQVNAAHPRRDKASDGTIGDAAHAATASDHNPDAGGVVRALDITHDVAGATAAERLDAHALADALVASRDPRLKYVISRGRIARSYMMGAVAPFTWARYSGADPHTSHVHVSVVADARADDARPWAIVPKPVTPKFPGIVALGSHSPAVTAWQKALNARLRTHLVVDGVFGPATRTAVLLAQRSHRLAPDGIAGPATWAALYR